MGGRPFLISRPSPLALTPCIVAVSQRAMGTATHRDGDSQEGHGGGGGDAQHLEEMIFRGLERNCNICFTLEKLSTNRSMTGFIFSLPRASYLVQKDRRPNWALSSHTPLHVPLRATHSNRPSEIDKKKINSPWRLRRNVEGDTLPSSTQTIMCV